MPRFLRTIEQTGVIYMILIQKRCIADEANPYGWANLKQPLFKSRKRDREAHRECVEVLYKFVVPSSCLMDNTLYRYRIVGIPGHPDGDIINLRCSNERIVLPKGFQISELMRTASAEV